MFLRIHSLIYIDLLLNFISLKVYEGLEFRLILEFPNGYPIVAPVVRFESGCFHPNVDEHGNICLGKLRKQ